MSDRQDTTRKPRRHAAGLFDIRAIIGALLGIYGVILVLTAIFGGTGTGAPDKDHANLWVGIILLAAGVFFGAWAKLRPVVVDEAEIERELAGERPPEDEPPQPRA